MFPTLDRKSNFGPPEDAMGTFGIGWTGSEGKTKKGGFHSGEWTGRKGRTFASCPTGAATMSCKDFEGSSVCSLENCISQVYPVSPSPLQISPPYPVPTLRGKNGVLCGGAQMPAISLSKEGRESDTALSPGASSALNVSPFSSHDFSLFEKTLIPCKFLCVL